jgi:GNAT superfamily N-acetyltransferase
VIASAQANPTDRNFDGRAAFAFATAKLLWKRDLTQFPPSSLKGRQLNWLMEFKPAIPVTLLGQLAVDKDYQGQGHASSLLLFALKTALHAAEIVGSMGGHHAPA